MGERLTKCIARSDGDLGASIGPHGRMGKSRLNEYERIGELWSVGMRGFEMGSHVMPLV